MITSASATITVRTNQDTIIGLLELDEVRKEIKTTIENPATTLKDLYELEQKTGKQIVSFPPYKDSYPIGR